MHQVSRVRHQANAEKRRRQPILAIETGVAQGNDQGGGNTQGHGGNSRISGLFIHQHDRAHNDGEADQQQGIPVPARQTLE